MWFCKVVTLLTITGFCYAIRRPESNSDGNRRVFRQRPRQPTFNDAEPLQSPTFSILSHLAQPLPIQGEDLNAYNEEFTSRSERLPFRSIRKPEPRRRSKPSFNISPPGVEKNYQNHGRPESRDESRKIPPVYVPKTPDRSPEDSPILRNEPEFALAEEDEKFKPYFPNNPIYAQESAPKKGHSTSALLTPDPEGNVDIQKENPGTNTNYESEQLNSHPQGEYEQIEVPYDPPQHYAPRPIQQQLSKRPDVNFFSQKHNQHSFEHNQYVSEPEVSTYRPDRVNYPLPINPIKNQHKHPNSYNQFNLQATPYKKLPERNVASDPKLFKPQNVPKKILRKQPAKAYNNYPTALKEPQLEKREAYDQQGSHSGGGHLDQNGVEFVSDASKTLKEAGNGRITFQIHGQEGPHSYRFGYDTGKGPHRQFRYEEKDGYGEVKGRYGYYDESGKLQLVNYSAHPEHGYQAEVVPAPKY